MMESVLSFINERLDRKIDVFSDLAEQVGRDVSAGVEWDGCLFAVRISVLSVRTPPSDLDEVQLSEDRGNLARQIV